MIYQDGGNVYHQASARTYSSCTPIYVGQHTVGQVKGDTFHKSIVGSKHLLQRPRALCFDRCTLVDAQAAGATRVEVLDRETGTIYTLSFEAIWRHCFPVRRGFGDQVGITLDYWSINGQEPVAEQQAAIQVAKHEAVQPALFDFAERKKGGY